MPDKPLVSVVIPAYNYARFLPAAIESVLSQTYRPLELIVVDDGSTDDTPAVVAAYGDRIRSIRKVNGGLSAARNTGIQAGQGEYFAFLDADDLWMPDKLAQQVAVFEQHPEAGCVGCGVVLVDGNLKPCGQSSHADLIGPPEQRVRKVLLRREWVGGSGSGALVKRAVLERVGLFDEELTAAEDWDMWLRIVEQFPVCNARAPLVQIRRHFTGTFRNAEKMERNQLAVFHKQIGRTPQVLGASLRRQVLAMIWADSALERMFAGAHWSAASRLLRALWAWPLQQGVWKPLAVCVARGLSGVLRPRLRTP